MVVTAATDPGLHLIRKGGPCRYCGAAAFLADETGPIHRCCWRVDQMGLPFCRSCNRGRRRPSEVASGPRRPKAGTRSRQVLDRLLDAQGGWVDGFVLATVDVGGSEGLRRLRELRDDHGWPIETRPYPDPSRDAFQYRLDPRSRP